MGTTMPEIRIDEQLFRLLKNHSQLEAFVILIERRASASDISRELGAKLNQVDYNLEQLEKMGLIEEVGTEQRRGNTATLYRAVTRPIWKSEEWGKLSQDERERYSAWVVQLFIRDVVFAWRARTFQARIDAHTSRAPLRVDEQGWHDLNRIQDEALEASREVEVESAERLRVAGDDGEVICVRTAMFCVEMPPARAKSRE